MKKFSLIIFSFVFLFLLTTSSNSQIIKPTGTSTEASSQLIYFYDEVDNGDTIRNFELYTQVTNTNDTQGVWIHVQIFRSFDPADNDDSSDVVICDERNFVDFLTPNDTHIYALNIANFVKNIGETGATPGELTTIDVGENILTKGFLIITPVVSESDLTAISFQHMVGSIFGASGSELMENAMGRDAVDFTTGEIVSDNTPLDGNTSGFVLLQPSELLFDFYYSWWCTVRRS